MLNRIKELFNDSHDKGHNFEKSVQNLFPQDSYILVEKTHDIIQNEDRFVESSLNPDFKFRCKKTQFEFYVEAKYRSVLLQPIINHKQYERYKRFQNLLFVIGANGTSYEPDRYYIATLQTIHDFKKWFLLDLERFPSIKINLVKKILNVEK